MEGRKSSKTTRSYGGAPRSSRNPPNPLPSQSSAPRPQCKERVRSAPLGVPQLEERQQQQTRYQTCADSVSWGKQTSEPISKSPGSLFNPVSSDSSALLQPYGNNDNVGDVQEVILAVLGAPGVGKSTFVRCALDLKRTSTSSVSCKKVSLEGKISIVRLLEIGLEDLELTADTNIHWPARGGDYDNAVVDGVLALYDVQDQSSVSRIPALLKALSNNGIPTILVSAKSDSPRGSWEVDHDMVEELCSTVTGIETFPVSLTAPDTHKRCISIILRNIMLKRQEYSLLPRATPTHTLTATQSTTPVEAMHSLYSSSAKSKHGRATSEVPNVVSQDRELVATLAALPRPRTADDPQPAHSKTATTTHGYSNVSSGGESSQDSGKTIDDREAQAMSHRRAVERLDPGDFPPSEVRVSIKDNNSDTSKTFLKSFRGSSDTQGSDEADVHVLNPQTCKLSEMEDDEAKDSGVTFEDLVDRLLAQPISKSDSKFAPIFLCLYRKFAPPLSLLEAIIRRFEGLNDRDLPHLARVTSQLRYLNVLKDWVSGYPGDFAHPLTRRVMIGFVQGVAALSLYATTNKEISSYLDVVVEDDDVQWACSDKSRSRANTTESFLTISSIQSAASTVNADSPTLTAESSTEDIVPHEELEKFEHTTISETPSLVASTDTSEGQTLLNTLENAQRQAQLLTPVPRYSLTKVQWHQFIDIPIEDVARELTRIDWIMYCSIRPRDLVRHVSLANDQKDKCTSLENFNRMIHHFNHVAFWVANIILLREKPKHRARAMEKFMGIAWKLRHLNNYNSLGAVISGINSIAVHRLAQTRELIPAPAQKEFMRLEILMGSQKSHSAYRLAWTNTPTQRIPFLPLHLRDLVLAEQGNRTYVAGAEGERINWKKFEIMGEVIIGVRKSQEVLYPTINKNEEVQRLILDGRFCEDEDELYERSIQLEGQGLGEHTRKKFNWFQR